MGDPRGLARDMAYGVGCLALLWIVVQVAAALLVGGW